jgi:exodeoxyribonuclease-1
MNGKADAAVFDLSYDPDEYLSLSVEDLIKVINDSKKKPIKALHANAQPILMPAKNAPLKTKGLEVSEEERMRRVEVIQNNPDFQKRVCEALSRKYENEEASIHTEQLLYSGGFPTEDEARIAAFQLAEWEERVKLADQMKDARVREFARRIVFLERPDLLTDESREDMKKWLSMRLVKMQNALQQHKNVLKW